jgi:hypothetical protein
VGFLPQQQQKSGFILKTSNNKPSIVKIILLLGNQAKIITKIANKILQ